MEIMLYAVGGCAIGSALGLATCWLIDKLLDKWADRIKP